MSAELNFEGRGLTRPDELLARVVVDLGLARQGDVLSAVDLVSRSRAEGDGRSLAQALQDMGSLHPRFVRVVIKAVNNKLVAEGHPPAPLPEPKSRPEAAKTASAAPPPAAPKPPPAAPPAAAPGNRSAPPAASAPAGGTPAAPKAAPAPPQAPARPAPPAASPPPAIPRAPGAPVKPSSEAADVVMPEAIFFKQAPRGEGFSRRSKSEIAAAWAKKKGDAPGGPGAKAPSRPKEFTVEDRLARLGAPSPPLPSAEPTLPASPRANPLAGLVGPKGTEAAGQGPPPEAPRAGNPLAALVGPKEPAPPARRGPVDPRVGLGLPQEDEPAGPPSRKKRLVNPLSALVSPKQQRGQPKGPPKQRYKRRKFAGSGVTQSIDVNDLRAELGIESRAKADPEADRVSAAEKQKSIELQAFVKRAVRSMLHQQCLDVVLRKRLMTVRASGLAQEAACRDRDARRVLDDWKSAGIMLLDATDLAPDPEFQFSPTKADLSTVRDFMVAWNDAEWHNRLLGWIIEEEHK